MLSHHVYRLLICGSKEGTKADSGVDLVRDVLMKPVARRKRAVSAFAISAASPHNESSMITNRGSYACSCVTGTEHRMQRAWWG